MRERVHVLLYHESCIEFPKDAMLSVVIAVHTSSMCPSQIVTVSGDRVLNLS